jgi:hypothetical protein
MSSQVTSDRNATKDADDPLPPHFSPRPKQDPVGMSALFVAVTVVCALGASSILISTRSGGDSLGGAVDNLLAAVTRIGAPAEAPEHTGSIATARSDARPQVAEPKADPIPYPVGNAQSSDQELARVDNEIASLKSAVAEVRKDVSSVKSLVAVSQVGAADAADAAAESIVNAAVAPLKADIGQLAAGLAAANNELAITQSTTQHMAVSIDQMTASHLRDIEAINRRIGKVEDVISLRADVTSAIPTRSIAPLPRKRALRRSAGWTAEETSPGIYLIKGPNVTYQVKDGDVIPDVGRIEVVRTADGKVRLLTGKDAVRR